MTNGWAVGYGWLVRKLVVGKNCITGSSCRLIVLDVAGSFVVEGVTVVGFGFVAC